VRYVLKVLLSQFELLLKFIREALVDLTELREPLWA
jgi:hypothetical protein